MSTILRYSAICIDVVFVICSLIMLWINTFATREELEKRNASILSILRCCLAAMIVIIAFVSLFSDSFETEVKTTSRMYFMVMISMLLIVLVSVLVKAYRTIAKKSFDPGTEKALRKLIGIAVFGSVISGLLGWLLS